MRQLVLVALVGCGQVPAGHHPDAEDVVDAEVQVDAPVDAGPLLASCKAIHDANPTAASGDYTIDPDGPGGDAPIHVSCDMTVDGGGWTIVFLAPSVTLASNSVGYTSSTSQLLADATDVLIAYRSSGLVAYPNHAELALPQAWQTNAPFDYVGLDVPVTASIDGGTPTATTLRFGHHNFSHLCTDDWSPTDDPTLQYGRICLTGTTAPFYSGFASATGGDLCSDSSQTYSTAACSADLQFSLAVR